jgi:hypothetical protein
MSTAAERSTRPSGRADAVAGALWSAFGVAVATGAWRMDRLERLNINPYEAPGLVPGVLGAVIALLGLVLAFRGLGGNRASSATEGTATAPGGVADGAAHVAADGAAAGAADGAPAGAVVARMALVLGLTLAYALVLVGRGLPFALATFIFVTLFIGLLDRERQRDLGRSAAGLWLRAAIFGAVWSAIVSLSFEHIFLVRLP